MGGYLMAAAVMAVCGCGSPKDELKPYIDFLQRQNTSAVDYVLELFGEYDIVILGERDHRDITQYEFIEKIISDEWFIDNVGHIFTEVGVHNLTPKANGILSGEYEDYSVFERELMKLYRDIDYDLIWEKYNFWYLLSSIHMINTGLDDGKKLDVHFTNPEFDWNNFIPTDSLLRSASGQSAGYIYDSLMGAHFISDYNRILENDNETRKKALVIFNSPHSYQSYLTFQPSRLESAASYIFDRYTGKVANVMINSVNWRKAGSGDYLYDKGKWDAAFRYFGNPESGFDMAGSPFGEVAFNDYDTPAHDTKFKDIFTGFIFYRPIHEWILMTGIPGFVDGEFKSEYVRRIKLTSKASEITDKQIGERIEYANKLRWNTVFDDIDHPSQTRQSADETIERWLK